MASWASKSWEPQGNPHGDERVGSLPPQKKTSKNGNGFKDFCYVHLETQGNDPNLTNILDMGSNHHLEKW